DLLLLDDAQRPAESLWSEWATDRRTGRVSSGQLHFSLLRRSRADDAADMDVDGGNAGRGADVQPDVRPCAARGGPRGRRKHRHVEPAARRSGLPLMFAAREGSRT